MRKLLLFSILAYVGFRVYQLPGQIDDLFDTNGVWDQL